MMKSQKERKEIENGFQCCSDSITKCGYSYWPDG